MCLGCRTAFAQGIGGDSQADRDARYNGSLKYQNTLTKQGKDKVAWDFDSESAEDLPDVRGRGASNDLYTDALEQSSKLRRVDTSRGQTTCAFQLEAPHQRFYMPAKLCRMIVKLEVAAVQKTFMHRHLDIYSTAIP